METWCSDHPWLTVLIIYIAVDLLSTWRRCRCECHCKDKEK